MQIVTPGGKLRGVTTPRLKGAGAYDVRAALRQLISGTALRVISDQGGIITLADSSDAGGASFTPPAPVRSSTATRSAMATSR